MIPNDYKRKTDLTYEERVKILENKIDKIRNDKEWAGDLAISALCLMLNLKINLYVKDNYNYKLYFSFEGSSKPNDTIDLLFVNSNHFKEENNNNIIFNKDLNNDNKNTDINKNKDINVSSDNKILTYNNNEKKPDNDNTEIKIFLKSIYNKYPEEKQIINLKALNYLNIGKDEYVEYDKKGYPNKYNDIYNFLIDNTFVPVRYRTTHKNKHIANKRTAFRKYARENYYIKDNRLYFKYKRYKNQCINVKIPFKGEVYPILKYIHINNNHIGYKNMCNQILVSELLIRLFS